MMITVVLSSNMRRMLKDGILVRKLVGIETAGSLNILFTDKTGTLTTGKQTVISIVDANGQVYDLSSIAKKPIRQTMRDIAIHTGQWQIADRQFSADDVCKIGQAELQWTFPLFTLQFFCQCTVHCL